MWVQTDRQCHSTFNISHRIIFKIGILGSVFYPLWYLNSHLHMLSSMPAVTTVYVPCRQMWGKKVKYDFSIIKCIHTFIHNPIIIGVLLLSVLRIIFVTCGFNAPGVKSHFRLLSFGSWPRSSVVKVTVVPINKTLNG